MQTFNLITLMADQITGIESFKADDRDRAVAYASGKLEERAGAYLEMFSNLKVRWVLDVGERKLGEITMATGPEIGSWSPVRRGKELELVWRGRDGKS